MAPSMHMRDLTPPYVGFATFKAFVAKLAETAIPPQIDTSVMSGKSAGTHAALRVALQFLGLIERDRSVTKKLHEIVEAYGTDCWADAVRELAFVAYGPIIDVLPLKTGTAKQLEDAFSERSDVSGSTLSKVVSFFLQILKEGDVEISSHFRAPKRRRAKPKKPEGAVDASVPDKPGDDHGGTGEESDLRVPRGWLVQQFSLPGRSDPIQVIMPKSMKAREWKMVSAYVTQYVDGAGGA